MAGGERLTAHHLMNRNSGCPQILETGTTAARQNGAKRSLHIFSQPTSHSEKHRTREEVIKLNTKLMRSPCLHKT